MPKSAARRAVFWIVYAAMLACLLGIAARFSHQWTDGAWNAQVAATMAQTGRYAVTYPSEEIFYVPITTGQTVLLPAALAFRLGGVTVFTAAIVPVLYMALALLALQILLDRFFRETVTSPLAAALLGGAATLACFFFFALYGRYAYQLLGEGAALLFLTLACLALARYGDAHRPLWGALCGAMLACALITKTVAICFAAVFGLLMLLECLLTRRYPAVLLAWGALGFLLAFAALESFKWMQLGASPSAYVRWWLQTIRYSFSLSSGEGASLPLLQRLAANLRDAADLFTGGYIAPLCVLLLLAPACWLMSAVARVRQKPDPFAAPGRFALLALGLGGDGFLVASLLFTSGGMFMERRVLLHGVCFFAFVLPVLLTAWKRISAHRVIAAALCALLTLPLLPGLYAGVRGCAFYARGADARRKADTDALIDAVSQLEQDAVCYGYGWYFAAETMLRLNLPLRDVIHCPPDFSDGRAHYLLVESYALPDALPYTLTPVWALRPNDDAYRILRIEPHE